MTELVYFDLGPAAYEPALALQQGLVRRAIDAEREQAFLLLLEHEPPVITLGRRGKDQHVLAPEDRLREAGIEVRHTSRGGDVTYHGPGQLVAYPILRVDLHGRDVHRYVRDLEAVVIRTAGRYGVRAERVEGMTGVWAGREKLAAIGVAVKRWVSYHGVALNVCPDLSAFEYIVPCGIEDRGVTSLSRLLGRQVPVEEVKPVLVEALAETFGFAGRRRGSREELQALSGRPGEGGP